MKKQHSENVQELQKNTVYNYTAQ